MLTYLLRRFGAGLLSLLLFTFVLFWLVETLIPGDAVTMCRLANPAEVCDQIREEMGLTDPIPVRWWRWVVALPTTGWGLEVFAGSTSLGGAVPSTLFVFLSGLLIAYLVGQWLGRVTGWRRSVGSDLVTLTGVTTTTLFPPFVGFLVVTFLGVRLRQLRGALFEEQRRELWFNGPFTEADVLTSMTWSLVVGLAAALVVASLTWRLRRTRLAPSVGALVVVAVMVAHWWLTGILPWALDMTFEAALPLIAFTLLAYGEFMLITQTGMVGVLSEDYIGTARAKGLSESRVRDRHAAPNASLAVLARLVTSIPYLVTGLVIVEFSVGWQGLGTFLFQAIDSQDIPASVSAFAVIGVLTLVVRLGLDVLLAVMDPRIGSLQQGERP